MRYTTGAPEIDVQREIPELSEWAKTAIRLHPRRGSAESRSSHIGGTPYWPLSEPWPRCSEHRQVSVTDGEEQGVPFVLVAQLRASDIPVIGFPSGSDLLQVLWCPHEHFISYQSSYDYFGPDVVIKWRAVEADAELFVSPPNPDPNADSDYIPMECLLFPEPVVEYPDRAELPEGLAARIDYVCGVGNRSYQYALSMAKGWKVGGWPSWNATDRQSPLCSECGSAMELLLKVDSSEWSGGSDRWRPREVQELFGPDVESSLSPTGIEFGGSGELRIFTCPVTPTHLPVLNLQ